MKDKLSSRVKRLEELSFGGASMWMVEVHAPDEWQPYQVSQKTGKEIERLEVMTYEEYEEWRTTLNKGVLVNPAHRFWEECNIDP